MADLTIDEIIELIHNSPCPPYRFTLGCVLCVRTGVSIQWAWGDLGVKVGGPEQHHPGWDHVLYLQANLYRRDVVSGDTGWGSGGKYLLSEHMTRGEVVKKCFVAARDFSEHEVREAFEYRGRRILGPHVDIDALWDVAERFEVRSDGPS